MLLWLLNLDFAGGFSPSLAEFIPIRLEAAIVVTGQAGIDIENEAGIVVNQARDVGA